MRGAHDEGALNSTLARPLQLLNDQPEATLFELAAGYGHVFADGHKSIVLVTIDLVLMPNRDTLTASEEECVVIINEVADGEIGQDGLAAWIEQNIRPFVLDDE